MYKFMLRDLLTWLFCIFLWLSFMSICIVYTTLQYLWSFVIMHQLYYCHVTHYHLLQFSLSTDCDQLCQLTAWLVHFSIKLMLWYNISCLHCFRTSMFNAWKYVRRHGPCKILGSSLLSLQSPTSPESVIGCISNSMQACPCVTAQSSSVTFTATKRKLFRVVSNVYKKLVNWKVIVLTKTTIVPDMSTISLCAMV